MNKHLARLAAVMAFGMFPALNTMADLEVSGSVQIHATAEFTAPLSAHGTWVEVGSYGRCWRPGHIVAGWRPYCAGEWVWTDCGWYWASDEPWGWACYHYGSWVYDPGFGWVWVPGVEWAPAWVSWRVGGGYIGWAPLPPPGLVFKHRPDPGHFVFVGTAHFGGPVISANLVFKDSHVFAKTSEIGGIKRESRSFAGSGSQKVMVNNGPAPEMVKKASGKSIAAVPIHEAARRSAPPKQMAQNSKSSAPAREEKASADKSGHGPDPDADGGNSRGQGGFGSSGDRPSHSGSPTGGYGSRGGRTGGGGHGKH